MTSRNEDNVVHTGTHQFTNSVDLPTETVTNASVKTAAAIASTKVIHRTPIVYQQDDGATVVSEDAYLYLARFAGTIQSVEVRPMTAPTGGDLKFTVDVLKAAEGSGSFSSILSAIEDVDSGSTDDTLQEVTIATPGIIDGDCLQISITISGSTGTQGSGVIVVINIDENPI